MSTYFLFGCLHNLSGQWSRWLAKMSVATHTHSLAAGSIVKHLDGDTFHNPSSEYTHRNTDTQRQFVIQCQPYTDHI